MMVINLVVLLVVARLLGNANVAAIRPLYSKSMWHLLLLFKTYLIPL
jgi:hypothetical protein